MSTSDPRRQLTRRSILHGAVSGAGLMAVAQAVGCGGESIANASVPPPLYPDPKTLPEPMTQKTVDAFKPGFHGDYSGKDCRMYWLVLEADDDGTVISQIKPRPISFRLPGRDFGAYQFALWATKGRAQAVAKMDGVKSVIEKQPSHVSEEIVTGPAKYGFLAVRVLQKTASAEHPHDDVATIVADLRRQLKDHENLVVNAYPKKSTGMFGFAGKVTAGKIQTKFASGAKVQMPKTETRTSGSATWHEPEPGQILIHFQGQFPAKVLASIKEHRQVTAVRWGGLFMTYVCPPCGMG